MCTAMRPLGLSLALLAVVALLWRSVTPAYACTCPVPADGPPVPQAYVQNADAIVVGTVTGLTITPPFDPNASPVDYSVYAIFQSEEYLKGTGDSSLTLLAYALEVDAAGQIYTTLAGCQNFNPDAVDNRYILFFHPNQPRTSDPGYCFGSGLLIGAQGEQYLREIRVILGATATPTPSTAPTPSIAPAESAPPVTPSPIVARLPQSGSSEDGSDGRLLIASTIAGLLGLTSVAAYAVRRRSSSARSSQR